jgi:hypothetical protein
MHVRALQHNITAAFERAVIVGLPQTISAGLVHPGIDYFLDEIPLRTPYADPETRKIAVQETYLNYLWSMFFALLVIQEEGITKPILDGTFRGEVVFKGETLIEARALFDWALTLRNSFSEWPHQLPNPETGHSTGLSAMYVQKVNGLFVAATSYVLCHEYSHLVNGHAKIMAELRRTPRHLLNESDRALGKQIEMEADTFARNCVESSTDATGGTTQSAIAAVMLHCADMLSFSDPIDVKQSLHPDVDQRLLNAINFATPTAQAQNFLWATASFVARKFFDLHRLPVSEPPSISSMQELFEYYLTVLDAMKQSQIL